MQCNAMQCNAMQCNAMQCNAMQCNAMQCNAMQCNSMQCNAMQFNAKQCNAMQCNAMQCNAMQLVLIAGKLINSSHLISVERQEELKQAVTEVIDRLSLDALQGELSATVANNELEIDAVTRPVEEPIFTCAPGSVLSDMDCGRPTANTIR